jgi:hypothetical protein
MFTAIQLAFAGVTHYILHWGLFGGLAIGLAATAWFSQVIPVVGPWLYPIRRDLYWAAFGCVLIVAGMYMGAQDATNRCEAKQLVIEKVVTKAVEQTTTPQAKRQKDRYDKPEY